MAQVKDNSESAQLVNRYPCTEMLKNREIQRNPKVGLGGGSTSTIGKTPNWRGGWSEGFGSGKKK